MDSLFGVRDDGPVRGCEPEDSRDQNGRREVEREGIKMGGVRDRERERGLGSKDCVGSHLLRRSIFLVPIALCLGGIAELCP